MKYRVSLLPVLVSVFGATCTPSQIGSGLAQAAALDALCITGYSVTIHQLAPNAAYRLIDFAAVLSNGVAAPVTGSVKLIMGVDATGLNLTGVLNSISAQSATPSFDTPVTTVYPANSSLAYTSPTLITLPYDPGANYTIEIHKWIAGQDSWDATPCHSYKVTKKFPAT